MTTTVHVSRTFHVDPEKNPQVLEELRLLAARGFEVLGPLDLTPVAKVAPAKPSVSVLESQRQRRRRFAELAAELRDSHGLTVSDVARLIGDSQSAAYSWLKKESSKYIRAPRESSIRETEKLLARARKLPKGSTALRDEARGVRKQQRRQGSGRKPILTDDQKLAIGVMAEAGSSLRAISSAFGVSTATVSRVIAELGGRKP